MSDTATESMEVQQSESAGQWYDALPDDIRDSASLSVFKPKDESDFVKVPTDLVKSYIHAQRLVGRERVPIPGPNDPPEIQQAFWAKLGVPEKPDGYELKPPKDVNLDEIVPPNINKDILFEEFKHAAHQLKLTKEQAEGLFRWWLDIQHDIVGWTNELRSRYKEYALQELQRRWGKAAESKMKSAEGILNEYGGPELIEVLEQHGVKDHPALYAFLAKISEEFSEDVLRGMHRGRIGVATPEEARAELQSRMADPELQKAYMDKTHPLHKQEVEYRHRLYKIMNNEL